MKNVIYIATTIIIFVLLTAGAAGKFGDEIREFSIVLFIAWSLQMLTRNWTEIKNAVNDVLRR